MPSYLDFNTTKTFRDSMIARTLNRPNGPQTFTSTNYLEQNLSDFPNNDPGDVITNDASDLTTILGKTSTLNIFKPSTWDIFDTLITEPRRANLSLYPYFTTPSGNGWNLSGYDLIGILTTSNYDNESELFKFASQNIRSNPQGPIFSRITQNLEAATIGRVRIIDALNGNTATALNLLTGREPLVEFNNKISVSSSLIGKGVDFLQTVAGTQLPFSTIPGDYLSNPSNPINYRPPAQTQGQSLLQDMSGAIGSLIGIERRPTRERKPSDLFIEHMGQGPKQALFNNLSFSKYAPNYTTTARSQNTSKVFKFIDKVAQSVKNALGAEAPAGISYIGDDRSDDVKNTMSDLNDRTTKSTYFLSYMFDPIQATLFEKQKNLSEGGQISGKLTWISKTSRNPLGVNNQEWSQESSKFNDSLSTKYGFRPESILGETQRILDSMPKDGVSSRSHVGNAIDQTSRIFKEGDSMISRGSAIKYVNQYNEEKGIEYCRVWTKDRSYMNYSDTMKRTANLRKFDDSILGGQSRPWNINIAPMSTGISDPTGKSSFNGTSTNIFEGNGGFYAKKYMFSLENLAWKTSDTPGFTYSDLPYCERGPNGGRVMWFAPYDLKINESNSARWSDNTFLGRPEPIYTYQDTTRTGNLSFKVVVDHPSILNLLVREHFKNMSDAESDNYLNAFFAGCEELDFYGLIRRYDKASKDDITLLQNYLSNSKNKNKDIALDIAKNKPPIEKTDPSSPGNTKNTESEKTKTLIVDLKYENDIPGPNSNKLVSDTSYSNLYANYRDKKSEYNISLNTDLVTLLTLTGETGSQVANEKTYIFNSPQPSGAGIITEQTNKMNRYFDSAETDFNEHVTKLGIIKQDLIDNKVQEITIQIDSSCSSVASLMYNEKLSLRRSHSIIQDIFNSISKDGGKKPNINWIDTIKDTNDSNGNNSTIISKELGINVNREYKLSDFGYDIPEGKLIIKTSNYGETYRGTVGSIDTDCLNKDFNVVRGLRIYSPIAFWCRSSKVTYNYNKQSDTIKPTVPPVPIIIPDPQKITKNPSTDPLKRIVARTLGECFYFKKLEEDSPLVFNSLKEKLKYFHPGFHSTTPEGLNSRLTFMLQCVRPGDTIPVKGVSDQSDLNARNTSFGPPPVCVLRIGDFYHSKIIIRDVQISYEDSTWDLNPEGIGVQPMIANVTCSIAFIGGQGIAKPVERLQNALSSNFFANTEMYDERSIETNGTFNNGQTKEEFTKKFLEELQKTNSPITTHDTTVKNDINNGDYLGSKGKYLIGNTSVYKLSYKSDISNIFDKTKNYFDSYVLAYNKIVPIYGNKLSSILLSPTYRTISQYDIFSTTSPTPSSTISLFGLYKKGSELELTARASKTSMVSKLDTIDILSMFKFDKEIPSSSWPRAIELLKPYLTKFIEDTFDNGILNVDMSGIENSSKDLIKSLDKLNFVIGRGKDTTIDPTTKSVKLVTLSGYTAGMVYNKYSTCIDYIVKNNDKLYSDLDISVNFNSLTMSDIDFTEIMSVLLHDYQSDLLSIFKVDTTLFPPSLIKKLEKRLSNFVTNPPKPKMFKFSNFKQIQNSNDTIFDIISEDVETNPAIVTETTNLYSNNVNPINNKLNFYRKS